MLIGSGWVCLFGQDQSGVDAALCRAHAKTPSFFRRALRQAGACVEEGGVCRAATDRSIP